MRIQVITPTIGTKHVQQAIDSVHKQTILTEHLVVCDGRADNQFHTYDNGRVIQLHENTGHSGFNGHRIYAAFPMLTDADYILFLDEDNWFEPDHVEKMVNFIQERDLQWAYSLRNIVSQEGEFVIADNCESLGKWPSVFAPNHHFVDTNCYCFKRKYLMRHSYYFFGNDFAQDRLFYRDIIGKLPEFDCNGEHTVNYRVRKFHEQMHLQGNRATLEHYKGNYPWTKNRKSL
jgi:glycosyltransferase involved in cell wall biosynthesis